MIDRDLITSKLEELDGYRGELDALLAVSDDAILHSEHHERLRAIERAFQLVVDTMLAINPTSSPQTISRSPRTMRTPS